MPGKFALICRTSIIILRAMSLRGLSSIGPASLGSWGPRGREEIDYDNARHQVVVGDSVSSALADHPLLTLLFRRRFPLEQLNRLSVQRVITAGGFHVISVVFQGAENEGEVLVRKFHASRLPPPPFPQLFPRLDEFLNGSRARQSFAVHVTFLVSLPVGIPHAVFAEQGEIAASVFEFFPTHWTVVGHGPKISP